jgi:hypothetical protein
MSRKWLGLFCARRIQSILNYLSIQFIFKYFLYFYTYSVICILRIKIIIKYLLFVLNSRKPPKGQKNTVGDKGKDNI